MLLLIVMKDPAEAVVMLIEGKEWAESMRIVSLMWVWHIVLP